MKIVKLVYVGLFLILLGNMLSCKKWLDKKPDAKLSTPETLKDLQAMVDNGLYINFEITPSLTEVSADDYFLLDNTVSSSQSYSDPYEWKLVLLPSSNDWRSCYIPIYNMNICLDQIKHIPQTSTNSADWGNVKGAALFIRSYFFLHLLWEFSKTYDATTANSDLGIALRLGSDFNVPSVRASVKECYDQIIADTKEAASYLPDMPVHPMRPSRAAAYGLLARIYLSMRDYENALKYSDLSLKIYKQLIDYNGDPDIVSSITGDTPPFKRFNKETLFYTEINFNHPVANPGFAKVDTLLYAQYQPDDLRKTAYFKAEGANHIFKASYTQGPYILFTGITTAEMYLVRAECLARVGNGSGDKDGAMEELKNLLSMRWKTGTYSTPVVATAKDALNIILKERRKELVFRGLRWADIKRLNKEDYKIYLKRVVNGKEYILEPNENRYALPLPQEIVDMTGMPQNPR